jgi:hypothetical protein
MSVGVEVESVALHAGHPERCIGRGGRPKGGRLESHGRRGRITLPAQAGASVRLRVGPARHSAATVATRNQKMK